tara:strand:- start:521 stop:754 length:234 start_codon:yes stop_codon:yes gene_type:complete
MPGPTTKKPTRRRRDKYHRSGAIKIVHKKPGPKHKGSWATVSPTNASIRREEERISGKKVRGAKAKTGPRGIGKKKK